jgi:hypothetical protein
MAGTAASAPPEFQLITVLLERLDCQPDSEQIEKRSCQSPSAIFEESNCLWQK